MRTTELLSSPLSKTQTPHLSSFFSPNTLKPLKHNTKLNTKPNTKHRCSITHPSSHHNHHDSPPPRKTLDPPWLVLPPPPPETPFSPQTPPVGPGIPFSLRLLQLKKRVPSPAVEDPLSTAVSRAVAALLLMIETLRRPAADDDEIRVSKERRDCLVWLFRRVFPNSPNLVPLVLLLLSGFLAAASAGNEFVTSDEKPDAVSDAEDSGVGDETVALDTHVTGNCRSWYDIGIKEGSLDQRVVTGETSEDRRRWAYERAIAEGETSSLVLSNYAQFLYRVPHDHDRAEEYFRWALMVDPMDAEAASRYAFFLWEERGDLSRAEEMFLAAIDAEPRSFYYSSNYAWFLWKTGAEDTCFPLSTPSHAPTY